MTQAELLINRIVDIGYSIEDAMDLVEMYERNNKIANLTDYILTKESLRSEL